MATNGPSSRTSRHRRWRLLGVSMVLASGIASAVAACSSDEPALLSDYDAGATRIVGSDGEAPETSVVDAGREAAVDDAGEADVDSGSDSFGDFADSGTECPRVNLIQERACENGCAKQARVCLPPDDAGADAAASLVWQPWGECITVVDDGCNPGTQRGTSCGRCGVKLETCQSDCTFSGGTCMAEGPCTPDQVERVNNLSCEGGYRERVCTKGCQWGPFGDCIIPTPPP